MTKFKDVAHMYMGVECYDSFNDENIRLTPRMFLAYSLEDAIDDQLKPFLRRLDSLTEEERMNYPEKVLDESLTETIESRAQRITYLLSLHIDLFNLIDNNEAIELKP